MTRSPDAADSDAVLIAAARDGDVASFGLLVERYELIAHRTAYLTGAGGETPDVVQEAFVKAFLALDRFRPHEAFQPWLLTIVANEARNRRRWFSRHRTVPLALLGDDVPHLASRTPEKVSEDHETSRALRDAVNALPRPHREVITCRYLLDLSEQETARVLGLAPGTVKSRLSRGLRTLQGVYRDGAAQRSTTDGSPGDD